MVDNEQVQKNFWASAPETRMSHPSNRLCDNKKCFFCMFGKCKLANPKIDENGKCIEMEA